MARPLEKGSKKLFQTGKTGLEVRPLELCVQTCTELIYNFASTASTPLTLTSFGTSSFSAYTIFPLSITSAYRAHRSPIVHPICLLNASSPSLRKRISSGLFLTLLALLQALITKASLYAMQATMSTPLATRSLRFSM